LLSNREPPWLEWARRLQAIAQNGLTYSQNPFDKERYEAVRRVAAEMMAAGSDTALEKVSRPVGQPFLRRMRSRSYPWRG